MLILKEIGIVLNVADEKLIWYKLDDNGEIDFNVFGAVESISNKEMISSFMSFAKGLEERKERFCDFCKKPFMTKSKKAKFCSNACTQKNKYKKKIETKI